jgi:hypothetical protein
MVQQAGMHKTAKKWLRPDRLYRLFPDPLPDRVNGSHFHSGFGHGSRLRSRF